MFKLFVSHRRREARSIPNRTTRALAPLPRIRYYDRAF
jgi:hypothetical protein